MLLRAFAFGGGANSKMRNLHRESYLSFRLGTLMQSTVATRKWLAPERRRTRILIQGAPQIMLIIARYHSAPAAPRAG